MRHIIKLRKSGNSCSISIKTKILKDLGWGSNELLSGYLVSRSGLILSKRNVDLGKVVFHGIKGDFDFVPYKSEAIPFKLLKQGSGVSLIIQSLKQEQLQWLIRQELIVNVFDSHIQIEPVNGCNLFNLPDLTLLSLSELTSSYRAIQNRLLKNQNFKENEIDTLALLANLNKLHRAWVKRVRNSTIEPVFTITD
ncbi:hypothetical protein [Photobacterium leiognathi]|uniref:hypothetical protein n=1 Tax=Photobacterium leiognathi TaxID=553611 RepID=UPI0029828D4D|nr:hypothetical protein [Photobacterium leiognathi]